MSGTPRPPRVSILIPNFNNGTQSSRSGRDNLADNLLRSIAQTLHDETTPFEVIAYDDGSTDDSRDTLREWAKKTWPGGQRFMELIEAEHCGYLSRIANVLSRRARGDILVRLDGDIICLTPRWVTALCKIFDEGSDRLGVVAPKQLRADGKIHAYGDMVLTPTGYSHVACGLERHAVRHMLQIDHAMGCFYCCRKSTFDDVGGYDENFLRGQTEDIGLRALLKGWQCFAVSQIEFAHLHSMRLDRETEADSDSGVDKALQIFRRKWGFCRIAPDMDEIRRLYAGTPLLWNKNIFPDKPVDPAAAHTAPIPVETSQWAKYTADATIQRHINHRVGIGLEVAAKIKSDVKPVILGAGQGLVPHLLAARGLSCLAFDERPNHVALAKRCIVGQKYPAAPPDMELLSDVRHVPLPDQSVDLLMIIDILERHPNPVALLREAARLLAPGRVLVVVTQRKISEGDPSDPAFIAANRGETRYTYLEIINQIQATMHWRFAMEINHNDTTRDPTLVCQRTEYTERQFDLSHIEPVYATLTQSVG